MLRRFFKAQPRVPASSVPPGERVYAIGDIHGRLDLLDDVLARIDADIAARPAAAVSLIFLGDLVDRGPDSAAVIERLLALDKGYGARFLMGNHEEIFLNAIEADDKGLRLFSRVGGRETAISYGMSSAEYDEADYPALAARLDAIVPQTHRVFMQDFESMIVVGDYAFVHAGVRPDVPLAEQHYSDLRWIRSTFLDHRGTLEKIIVHGHTVTDEVEFRPHRIGIDTGAYLSGKLTALALEGEERWLLQTEAVAVG